MKRALKIKACIAVCVPGIALLLWLALRGNLAAAWSAKITGMLGAKGYQAEITGIQWKGLFTLSAEEIELRKNGSKSFLNLHNVSASPSLWGFFYGGALRKLSVGSAEISLVETQSAPTSHSQYSDFRKGKTPVYLTQTEQVLSMAKDGFRWASLLPEEIQVQRAEIHLRKNLNVGLTKIKITPEAWQGQFSVQHGKSIQNYSFSGRKFTLEESLSHSGNELTATAQTDFWQGSLSTNSNSVTVIRSGLQHGSWKGEVNIPAFTLNHKFLSCFFCIIF